MPVSNKVFVDVTVKFDKDGNMQPLSIVWEDGMQYEIDRIIDIRRAASLKAGGQGTRFTCFIEGKRSYLFYEAPRWFMERA